MKKIFTIISLILSALSMVYMCLVYFGIIRYMQVHFYSTESYASNYKNLEKADEKNRVVVSFTATPEEMKKLKPFINSLLDQTVKVDEIALSIPYKDMGSVPPWLKKIADVYGYSNDYDDAGGLISSVLREGEEQTKIIVVEPRMVYGKDFIQTMVEESDKHPKSIIYGGKSKETRNGVLIKPVFFDVNISQYRKGYGCNLWLNECARETVKEMPVFIGYSETYRSL